MSDNGRKASVVYEGNGSQTIFLFPFDYLRKAFIYAQDIQNDNVKDLIQGVDFEMDNNRHIHLNTPLKTGHLIRIFRKTTTKPLVEWQDASVLRSSDLTLQEVQLLHLAEETSDKVVDSAGLSVDPMNTMIWNANFKRIGNVLDPIRPNEVVTLGYILSKQDNILNQMKQVGQNEIKELSATYNTHKATLEQTGRTERQDIERKGSEQVNKVTDTANEKLNAIKTKGDEYISTQTTLKEDTRSYANQTLQNKNLSAGYKDTAQKWAESIESPDNTVDSESDTSKTQSSRSWALLAKALYLQIESRMTQLSTMLQQALSSLNEVKAQQSQIKTDMVDAKNAKTEATTQANKSKEYATEALNSANAAKQSAKEAAKFDPSSYNTQEENDRRYVQKTTANDTYLSKTAAESTYLSKATAQYMYLNASNAQQMYLSKTDAESTYLSKTVAEKYCLTIEDAQNTYLMKQDAKSIYLRFDEAQDTYVTQTFAFDNFQHKGNYVKEENIYDSGMLKLPNGAKIGVE